MDVNWIITVFVITDDLMKQLEHKSHHHATVSDSEIILVAIVAAKYFNNNHKLTLSVLARTRYLKTELDPSRFNRRLHALADWFELIIDTLAELFQGKQVFVIDSLPVPVCRWARRWRSRKVRGREFCGYCAAKKEKFYGYRLHLICTPEGQPVRFSLLPAHLHDLTPIHELTYGLGVGAKVYGDKGYNCLKEEASILEESGVRLIPIRRKNMENHNWEDRMDLRKYRKSIETANSQLEKFGLQRLYARTNAGFELKVLANILALAFTNY
jgi:hypothetical protein